MPTDAELVNCERLRVLREFFVRDRYRDTLGKCEPLREGEPSDDGEEITAAR